MVYLLVLRREVLSFPWNGHVDFTPHDCHIGCDEADVSDSFLHDDSSYISVLRNITGRINSPQ